VNPRSVRLSIATEGVINSSVNGTTRLVTECHRSGYFGIISGESSDVCQEQQLCLISFKDFLSRNLIYLSFQIDLYTADTVICVEIKI
jgi:hypothetical protein